MSLEINFTISTNRDMDYFWGYSKRIKVLDYNMNGELGIIKEYDEVVDIIITDLKKDCEKFPVLQEKIKLLKLHSHGDYYDIIFNNYTNPDFIFYICHHN